jgi:hypothetical protein
MAKIKGTNQADVLPGTALNDRIFGKNGNDILSGLDGNDKLWGGKGDDDISGDAGKDKIWGQNGNDTLNGGLGNDDIDGGRGIDTAVFSGSYDDYVITSVHHGHGHHHHHGQHDHHKHHGHHDKDLKIKVWGPDGFDQVQHVEFLQFEDATYNVKTGDVWQYAVNAAPDASAQDPSSPGNLYVGSGIPATGFGIARNEDAGIELGLQVIYRQGPTITTTDDYADGVLHFAVNDGAQSIANGSLVNNAARAAWSFEYSIATGLNGETTDLGDFTFKLLYDVDPSAATSYRTLVLEAETTLQAPGQSGYQWRDEGTGLVFIADDEGTANVTQNSENYSFAFFQSFLTGAYGPGNSFAGPAYFDIQLQAFDPSNNLIAQNHISVDVIL